jgi:hypothetical protein
MKRWVDKWQVIAVNDAYKVMPWADAMYAADNRWWELRKGTDFKGEKWACHEHEGIHAGSSGNDKRAMADEYGLNIVCGRYGSEFSTDPTYINYGDNSGFQAVNLALLFGCKRIVLVGFDMRGGHFFGDYKDGLHNASDETYAGYAKKFAHAAKHLPADVSIVNATSGSAMKCFPMMSFEDATRTQVQWNDSLHSDGAVVNA